MGRRTEEPTNGRTPWQTYLLSLIKICGVLILVTMIIISEFRMIWLIMTMIAAVMICLLHGNIYHIISSLDWKWLYQFQRHYFIKTDQSLPPYERSPFLLLCLDYWRVQGQKHLLMINLLSQFFNAIDLTIFGCKLPFEKGLALLQLLKMSVYWENLSRFCETSLLTKCFNTFILICVFSNWLRF